MVVGCARAHVQLRLDPRVLPADMRRMLEAAQLRFTARWANALSARPFAWLVQGGLPMLCQMAALRVAHAPTSARLATSVARQHYKLAAERLVCCMLDTAPATCRLFRACGPMAT
jgi:hypothetical protein